MSYTPFPVGAKSPTLDAMFTDRMRQFERRCQAALRMLSGQKKLAAKSNLFTSAFDLFMIHGCLVGQQDCMGFKTLSDWDKLPAPIAEVCECKKISEYTRQHFATYFLDAFEKEGVVNPIVPTKSWVQVANMIEGHRAVLQIAYFLLAKSSALEKLKEYSPSAQNVVALAFLMNGPTHTLLDWSDFLAGLHKSKISEKHSALNFLNRLQPKTPFVLHLGDYRFRLKPTSRADVTVFDRLVTELDNRNCPLLIVSQQELVEAPVVSSMLSIDYRVDAREQFTDAFNKTRFTSTKRKTTEAMSLLECLPNSTADRLIGLLAEGQQVFARA